MNNREARRGEIWWWRGTNTSAEHVQRGERPALVISNDICNTLSDVVTIIPCTHASRKKSFPQHRTVRRNNKDILILCDQLVTVNNKDLVNFKFRLTDSELHDVEKAVIHQLGISHEKIS